MGTLALTCSLRAEQVEVQSVEGQVYYGAGNSRPTALVKVGQILSAGTFSSSANGILSLSTFAGSELRLAESGMLRYEGTDAVCRMAHAASRRSTFHLKQGKLQITMRYVGIPAHCYQIVLEHGTASVESGQCVMCMHGMGTFVFVSRGVTVLENFEASPRPPAPRYVPPTRILAPVAFTQVSQNRPMLLTGDGHVGHVGTDGAFHIEPLSAISAGEQNCLLGGLHVDAAAGSAVKPPVDSSQTVSPIQ